MLNEQKDQISNIMSVLDSHRNVETEVKVKKKGKTKKKDKNSDEFYHVNIWFKVMYFFILFTKYNNLYVLRMRLKIFLMNYFMSIDE